jgi:cobalt transporter subunit CbtB
MRPDSAALAGAKSCQCNGNQALYRPNDNPRVKRPFRWAARQMGIDMSQIRTASQTEAKLNTGAAALAAAMIVAVFGAVFVYGIGFAGADVLHNAAHDARHANNFPCH